LNIMSETGMPGAKERIEQVGPDRVTLSDERVVIDARRRMPDWKVHELNPVPVYFGDKKYHLQEQRRAEAPYTVRYILRPWPEDQFTSSKLFYTYDAEAVAARDAAFRTRQAEDLAYAFLLPVYPLLGLLWSGAQKRLSRFGIVPRTVSGLSIYSVFALLFSQGVFAVVTIQATVRSGKMLVGGMITALSPAAALHLGPFKIPLPWLDMLLTLALLADVAVRYSLYLREDQWNGGFLEWLVRRAPEDDEALGDSMPAPRLAVPAVEGQTGGGWEHHRFLARLSFWVPAAVLPFCVAADLAFRNSPGTGRRVLASCGWLLALTLAASLGLSLAALSGIRRHGSHGILWPALRGLALMLVLGALFLTGVVTGFRNAVMVARARETAKQVNADLKEELISPGGLTNSLDARQAGVEKVRGALDSISRNASGDTALIAKVSSQHVAKMQKLMTNYNVALKNLNKPPLLDMSAVTNRQQLLARKELARKFLAANAELQAFVAKMTESYRQDLCAAGAAPDQIAAALAGYERSAAVQQPLLMRIREDDRAFGNCMLNMLEILDSNWGKWTYNPTRKKVDFDDMATLDKFITCRDALQSAARDQQRQQLKLASLMR
jgi:hypothetical protein